MQPSGHSSLPSRPQWPAVPQQVPYQNVAAMQNYFQRGAYSSHYAQAYLQAQGIQPALPAPPHASTHGAYSQSGPSSRPYNNNNANRPQRPVQPTGAWYQAGHSRCSYKNCQFTGAPKALEIHMMDRHLIFPPGWDKKAKKDEWDADPSLKGKRIPIQGTNLILDTPETLEAWKEERRKRFPTAHRVDDKKRKMEEAVARGQLTVEDMGVRPEKRRRTEDGNGRGDHHNSRGNGRRGRGRPAQMVPGRAPVQEAKPVLQQVKIEPLNDDDSSSSSSDDDAEPEVSSSKAPVPPLDASRKTDLEVTAIPPPRPVADSKSREKRPLQPKKPLANPFNNRAPLLRSLILPEIRVTVSNLSQAIRFLVDNDFLSDVELKPGQADERPIQVISSTEAGA
ncbi:hypothetical protein BKA70DRAFT_330195 [Coprinopsis sp. MPI-PUGE-AT-0042]|nr:hypothetical protein BKA70DRAFT_330195 [Coprinopsis sp. MPI-PUGE-AT-0042]